MTQTQAAVSQSQASVNQNQVNLDHTIITAPIDGIVTQRSVDVGQTVAASMQAPTLFIIAADLTKMQVNANIDEADVGRIRPGQHVTFRVDAYPTDTFEGTVSQIRLQPVVVQNVTTYGTVIDVPNAQLKLKPGMTANVKVEIAKRTDVLRVPNAALRFRPTPDVFAALNQPVPPEAQIARRARRARRPGRRRHAAAQRRRRRRRPAHRRQRAGAARPRRSGAAASAPAAGRSAGRRRQPSGGGAAVEAAGGRRRSAAAADADSIRRAMMERFKGMSPDEQQQFIARMKERGQDTSAFEKDDGAGAEGRRRKRRRPAATPASAQTIDALFAPLPLVETRGRVWLFMRPSAEAGEPAPRHHRRHEHRAAQRRAAAEHGSRDRRHRPRRDAHGARPGRHRQPADAGARAGGGFGGPGGRGR